VVKADEVVPGTNFTYTSRTTHDNKEHVHICRVLFKGSDSVFFDAYWPTLNKWTFEPARKNLVFYRYPISTFENVEITGFSEISSTLLEKLYIHEPEVLFRVEKGAFMKRDFKSVPVYAKSSHITFLSSGPKGGWQKKVVVETTGKSSVDILSTIRELQNPEFIEGDGLRLHRAGLSGGFPSYCF
jgi:hypothetical protein